MKGQPYRPGQWAASDVVISLRLTRKEARSLKQSAQRARQTVSEFVRRRVEGDWCVLAECPYQAVRHERHELIREVPA